MKVLIACEFSGIVREAFKRRGHDAWSCDLLDTEIPGNHIKGDCLEAIKLTQWDFIGLHLPCTKVCISGNHIYAYGKPKYTERVKAVKWMQEVWNLSTSKCDKVYLENPQGVLNTMGNFPKPQYIQPYEFGHPESKKTGLWLYGLPDLKPTNFAEWKRYRCKCGYIFEAELGKYGCPNCNGEFIGKPLWDNQTPSGQNKLGPSENRWKERSRTYPGIAQAMAEQWG